MGYIKEEKMIEGNGDHKTFTNKYVLEKCLEYFDGDELASEAWMNKYAVKDTGRNLCESTPEDMHRRMSKEFYRIESKYTKKNDLSLLSNYGKKRTPLSEEDIFNYLDKFKYIIPQGSIMSVLGNPYIIGSLSNCIVVPKVYDSYGGICYTDQQLVQLMKRRCGVGVDISTLRPYLSPVQNAAGTSTGAISFMERFSSTTREVAQSGRRGALMITIDVNHPNSMDFALIKQDLKKVTGANISIRLSNEFMEAVRSDSEYIQKFPVNSEAPTYSQTIRARDLWNVIIKAAHGSAEPGLIFWDRQHWYSTSSVYPEFENISTNPCSEIAMGNDSCRLVALNMFSCVVNPFEKDAYFDFDKWYEITYEGQRLNDNVVDLELEAIERILKKIDEDPEPDHIKAIEVETWKNLYDTGKRGRRTGLGFTALGDTLAALGVGFDSSQAITITDSIMKTKCRAEFESSVDMSIERGCFDGFDPDIENTSDFIKMMKLEFPDIYDRMMKHGRRNISLSTVAPTGTLSLLAQTSSGVEPVFMISYTRRKKINPSEKDKRVDFVDKLGDSWQEYDVFHPKFKMWSEITGGSLIEESPYYKSTAEEIDWEKRVELQSVIQKYITHSISSTINLPEDVSIEKVGDIYMRSWEMGLKGITVYRSGSRSGVLISKPDADSDIKFDDTTAPKRPKELHCDIVRFQNNHEKWIAFVGLVDNRPYEIFTGRADDFIIPGWVESGWIIRNKEEVNSRYDFKYTDKQGYGVTTEGLSRAFNEEYWNYARLISGLLRHGMAIKYIIKTVDELRIGEDSIVTWKAGIIRALKKFVKDGDKPKDTICSECGDEDGLIYEEGCLKCKSCGNGKC